MADELQTIDPELGEDASEESAEQGTSEESSDPLDGQEDLQKALFSLYIQCCSEDRQARLTEVKDVKQAELYWGGRQYDWWSWSDKQWNLPSQAQGVNYGDLNVDDMPRFEFVTNIYQAHGLGVIGAVAGAVPRIRFFPADADNSNDLETAEGRSKLAKLIQRWNPPQKLLQEETYHAYTGGFIALRAKYVSDADKYGSDLLASLEESSEQPESNISCPQCGWSAPADQAQPPVPCPKCGAPLTEENISQEEPIPLPQDGEETAIAKGREVISVYGALNCKRPQHVNHQSQYHYFAIEDELHYSILRDKFQDKADKIKAGDNFGADDVFERNARLSVAENTRQQNQTGTAQQSLVTFATVWFRSCAFRMISDKKKREQLLDLFPRGCRVEFAGPTYCVSEAESMDDAIVTCHAMPGRGQHRPALGSSMISVQDRFNTFSNISAETYEYGIPITYRGSSTFDAEADADQRAAPGLEVEVMIPPGQDIRQQIMQVRADSVSPDMQKHMMDMFGPVAEMMSGNFPALSGAGDNQPETLGQQAMQRDQAMGRMGVPYVNLKQAHADIMTLACRDFEAHTDGEIKIPVFGASGDFESESVDITAMDGEAEAYPEGDENFPELWNQQRATFMQIADTPYGQELMKDPGNAELGVKLTGIPDLKVPKQDAWRKQLKEISEMTKMPSGMGEALMSAPMVEVDAVNDDHGTEEQCCGWWLNSEPGQKLKRLNPQGWQLVSQHRQGHKQAIPPPAPPEKPLSETLSAAFKDMPPEAQAQVLAKWGIHVTPQDFLQGLLMKKAEKTPTPAPGMPHPAGHESSPPAGAHLNG